MTTEELSNILTKLRNRIKKNKVYNPDAKKSFIGKIINKKQYYFRREEIEYFITVLTNLQSLLQTQTATTVSYGSHRRRRHKYQRRTEETTTVSDDDSTVVMVGYGCRHLRRKQHRNHFFLS
jgi:hypothetical protein